MQKNGFKKLKNKKIYPITEFCVNLRKPPMETNKMTEVSLGNENVWHKRFSDSRTSVCDDRRSSKLVITMEENNVNLMSTGSCVCDI